MNLFIKKIVAITILTSFLSLNSCLAAIPLQYSDNVEAQLEEILGDAQTQNETSTEYNYLKAGESFAIELLDDICSQGSEQDEKITARLIFPLELNGQIIAPEGSVLTGKIIKLHQAGGWYKSAVADIEFQEIDCGNNYKLPILAKIKTKDGSGLLKGAAGKERFGKVFSAIFATSLGGALAGLGIGLMSSSALVGAVAGITCGAIICSGWLFFQKGKPINIPAGTKLVITLKNDISVDGFEI